MSRNYQDVISPSDLFDAKDSDVQPEAEQTHYVQFFCIQESSTRNRGARVSPRLKAACGSFVDYPKDHSTEPTCEACAAVLEQAAEDDGEIFAELGYEKDARGVWVPKGA